MFDKEKFESSKMFFKWALELHPETIFNFLDNNNCLFATWAKECGAQYVLCGTETVLVKGLSFSMDLDFQDWSKNLSMIMKNLPDPKNFTIKQLLDVVSKIQ